MKEKKPQMSWEKFNKVLDAWCEKRGCEPVNWKDRKAANEAERKIREKRAEEKLPR